ncbi:MAG: GH116 family glycosyl-hydrolase [Candidatus Saccharicenans sp.]
MVKIIATSFRTRIALFIFIFLILTLSAVQNFLAAPGRKVFLSSSENLPALKIPYSEAQLFSTGRPSVFSGEKLREIAFPLGGIGTGTISLGGRGQLRDWEIFNRPGKGLNFPFTFFAVYVESGGKKFSRVLEAQLEPPYTGGHGIPREGVPGLPRFREATFRGEYPMAEVELTDPDSPVKVTLEAFNPFVPGDAENSGLPAAVLKYHLKNLTDKEIKVTVVGSLANPVGFDGQGEFNSLFNPVFGQNVNRLVKGQVSGLYLYSKKVPPDSPAYGTLALATAWTDLTYVTHWVRGDWWDDLQIFWDDFSSDGELNNLAEEDPSSDGRTDVGSLGLRATIPAGSEVVLPFIISWHYPNLLNYFDVVREQRGRIYHPHYTKKFKDAWQAAEYLFQNLEPLEKKTRQFRESFFFSSLPPYVLEAVSSQASIIRTPTCFWLDDGRFFAFEGCSDRSGCCPLNCAHVWNYAQSLAFLFPELERSMRETDFLVNVKPDGSMVFRTSLPLGEKYWDFKPAADGQLGRIINLYRDWQISGDLGFLKKIWPLAKKALEYAWVAWDKDRDGLLEGEQHNTYDIEFYGPNSMLSGFYLGALEAGARMAEAVGDRKSAAAYRQILSKGKKNYEAQLWNGEFFIQKYDQALQKKYQYGEGCLSDQLLGQWLSMVAGLGRFLDEAKVKKALESIYRYNFRENFFDFANVQRTYALADEKGLLLCTWPRGGRPLLPFPYSDEVWTGIEYQVASHLIYEGMLREGLSIVKAVRERYDGRRRNPWNEVECGHHYARAMSSWGLLLALSGFNYSVPEGRLGFAPALMPEDFRAFWSLGPAWGTYEQHLNPNKVFTAELKLEQGSFALNEFDLKLPDSLRQNKINLIECILSGQKVSFRASRDGSNLKIIFSKKINVFENHELNLEVRFLL